MLVKVNGEFVEIEKNSTIDGLLNLLDIPKVRIAVELNGETIPYSELLSKSLSDQYLFSLWLKP